MQASKCLSPFHYNDTACASCPGEIDRDALGAAVFADPAARRRLNAATHLPLACALLSKVLAAWLSFSSVVIVDMPLLFETGASRLTKPRVLVACDEHTQRQRLMARNGLTAEQASARVGSQMPLEAKRRRADVVMDNSGSQKATQQQVCLAFLHLLDARPTALTAGRCSRSDASVRSQPSFSSS